MICLRGDLRGPISTTALILAVWAAPAAQASEPADPQGFLYGKVETRGGSTYQGRLRWANEEAFWGDHFDSAKIERPHLDKLPPDRRKEPFRFLGFTFQRDDSSNDSRGFVARFGDLRRVEARPGRKARLTMRSGTEIEVQGGSDVGASVRVWDPEIGEIEIPWKNLVTVEFLPTPADLEVPVRRLHGSVETASGTFEGFIQWDKDECLTSDKLDGDSRDGEVSAEMGKIRRIEKHTRSSSRVVFRSGRELVLEDSNDVDDHNRGIFVEDSRFGRVLIPWSVFEHLELTEPAGSGPSFDDFADGGPLYGKVTTRSGAVHGGRIFYDLDESETWEILSGERREIEYHIPLSMVASVAPNGSYHSRVTLTNGEELELQNSADVDQDNSGIAVDPGDGGEVVYVPWDEVARIDFLHPEPPPSPGEG